MFEQRLTARGHRHAEAFCLMTYRTEDGAEIERIWNSRDGVTPFIVSSRDGREMRHVEWSRDEYLPDRQPQAGERIFVDLTPEIAERHARERVERYWDDPEYPMSRMCATKDEAIATLAKYEPGAPTLITVEE
jgi:hypothetical protein